MILKLTGAVLVIISSGGLGIYLANQWKEHLKTMEELRKMIFLLKGQILYANAPLEEAFERVGEKCSGKLSDFFLTISQRIASQRGEPFYEMWKQEIENLDRAIVLSEKDKQELVLFGEHLGYLDSEMQERTILLYLEQLDITINYLREHLGEKSRLYTSLGIMGGIFLTIVMY